ncbi:putative leader peptide [Streptomyces erythrochromogenes]|uniref:putative leader peptide n=1 Tax=Streptomyces erythrochromogenes TaxID=285574 RepID=UPI00380A1415
MQPLGDRTVTLFERRHVDLVRVASAICRCSAQPQLCLRFSLFRSAPPCSAVPRAVPRPARSLPADRAWEYLCLRTRTSCPGGPSQAPSA